MVDKKFCPRYCSLLMSTLWETFVCTICRLCAAQIVLPPSPPGSPGQPRGQRKNVCDKKGRGTGKGSEKRAVHWKMKGLK